MYTLIINTPWRGKHGAGGVNPSCGDDIVLLLKVEDDKIVDGAFQGDGCAVSQASADMMLDLIIGKSRMKHCAWQIFSCA